MNQKYVIQQYNIVQTSEVKKNKGKITLVAPTLAVTTRAKTSAMLILEESSDVPSEDSLHFSELKEARKNVKKVMAKRNEPPPLQLNDDEVFQFVRDEKLGSGMTLVPRVIHARNHNPAKPYNLWADLCNTKANISIAQLIQVAPSIRKGFKEGATLTRKPRKVEIAAEVEASTAFDVGPIELEVGIMDKIIPNALVDGGSGLNIMPLSTMEKLGFKITGPSAYVVNLADQSGHIPIGQIANYKVCIGDEEYNLTFHVICLQTKINVYSLLLGRTWLQLAEATTNWSPDNPSIIFGPPTNRTIVTIKPKRSLVSGLGQRRGVISNNDNNKSINPKVTLVGYVQPSYKEAPQKVDIGPLRCMGPGLYDWTDDGEFTTWLANHPTFDHETSINCITEFLIDESNEHSIDLATLVDDITYEDVSHLEIDGTQIEDLEPLMKEEDILPNPLHFRRTSSDIEVS
jgi:hypothetical protein